MLRDDVLDVLEKLPSQDISKAVLVLKHGASLTVDSIIREETDYLVLRGREAGTNDEERLFFVPFEEVLYIKLDRKVKINEVKRMYGEKVVEEVEQEQETKNADAPKAVTAKAAPASPVVANDPASIAKQNLLAKIRAARSAVSSTSSGG